MKKREMKSYYKRLRENLLLSHSAEEADEIISRLQSSAADFFEDNPGAGFDEFLEHFGDIEELHYSFLENAQDLSRQIRKAHFKKTAYTVILIIVMIAAFICSVYIFKDYLEDRQSIIKYEVIEIE